MPQAVILTVSDTSLHLEYRNTSVGLPLMIFLKALLCPTAFGVVPQEQPTSFASVVVMTVVAREMMCGGVWFCW